MRTVLLLGLGALAGCDVVFPPHDAPAPVDAEPDLVATLSVDEPVFVTRPTQIRLAIAGDGMFTYDVMAPGALGPTRTGTASGGDEVKVEWTPTTVEDATITASVVRVGADPGAKMFQRVEPVLDRVGHLIELPTGGGATMVSANQALAVHFKLVQNERLVVIGAQLLPNNTTTKQLRFAIYGHSASNGGEPSSARAVSDPITVSSQESLVLASFASANVSFLADEYWIVMFTDSDITVRDDGGSSDSPPAHLASFAFPASGQPVNFPAGSGTKSHGISLFAGFGAIPAQ